MVRYFLKFSYIGTQYRGAQKQLFQPLLRDTDTIQGALESALRTILPKNVIEPLVHLSSRTDAGVHALCSTAHVELENRYNQIYNTSNLIAYVNRFFTRCGHTIRLLECIPVTNDFHARYSSKSRTYVYRFMIPKVPGEQRVPIIEMQHSLHLRVHDFDVDRAKRGTQLFMGIKDFTTFSAQNLSKKNIVYIRSLHAFTLEEVQPLMSLDPLSENFRFWHFTCKARSFLYNQVRRMVGSLIALGLGQITEKDITVMLQVPSHYNWNVHVRPVPSNGLHLVNVEYDPDELKRCTILEEFTEESVSTKLPAAILL